MLVRFRAIVVLAVTLTLAACGARSGGLLPSPGTEAALRSSLAVPVDIGRRAPSKPTSVVLLLRYNRQAELTHFVDGLARSIPARFLTPAQFVARYAATPQQERSIVDTLRREGFTITKRTSNRTLIDAVAPAAVVERVFGTQIHDYRQGRFGIRFHNVTPVRIPPSLAGVAAVNVDTVVWMHTGLEQAEQEAMNRDLPPIVLEPQDAPALRASSANVVGNPGFESGHLSPWRTCHSSGVAQKAVVSTIHPHSGKYDAYAGTFTNRPEPNGLVAVCQTVTIPSGATLTAYTWGVTNDRNRNVEEFGALYNASTLKLVHVLFTSHRNNPHWVPRSFNLSAYAGQRDVLAFGVVGSKSDYGKVVGQFLDDVSLTGSTTSPTPTPTTGPTTEPATQPCPTPATGPLPTPNFGPDNGWGPAAVEGGMCMPAAYGYNGTGETAAIVIDDVVKSTDLSTYLAQYGITQTGTVTNESVDGASATNDSEGEATLDLETISSLAPGANIILYYTGSLENSAIVDAYNQVLTDGKATVVNSSFGGCEAPSSYFNTMTEAIAVQGAATGITFSASSGDQGADCYVSENDYAAGVNAPASDPHFVAVGGTQSTPPTDPYSCAFGDPTGIGVPAVWNDCVGSGGGGVSAIWTPPPNQAGIPGASTAGRNVPDIALPAAFDDTYRNSGGILSSGWSLIWGTSWASPIYVAMQTEINQACGTHIWGTTAIYGALAKSGYTYDFIDVTSGNNLWSKADNYGLLNSYDAGNGFDNVSGIGIPLGIQIAIDNCSLSIPHLRTLARRHVRG